MPTYFGPTNIPPYEAFKLGTPVIYPNLEGLKDQIYEEGLIDLNNPDSLALNHKKVVLITPDPIAAKIKIKVMGIKVLLGSFIQISLKRFLIRSFSHNNSGSDVTTYRNGKTEAVEINSANELNTIRKMATNICFPLFLEK